MNIAAPPKFSNSRYPLFPPETSPEKAQQIVRTSAPMDDQGRYWHWDKLKDMEPPGDWSVEEWWAGMKWARTRHKRHLPFVGKNGAAFMLVTPACVMAQLNWLDRRLRRWKPSAGWDDDWKGLATEVRATEAACSCALDGVVQKDAWSTEFLRDSREPQSVGEWVLFDNFQAMEFIRTRTADELSPELMLELYRFLTVHSGMELPPHGGLRTEMDCFGGQGKRLWHEPPAANELQERVFRLCSFTDTGAALGASLHPIISSLLLPLMVLYDQPFAVANGRLARALFYWNMLRNGYEFVTLLSISQVLLSAYAQYERSFRYVVTDENDATYFVIYHLDILIKALGLFEKSQESGNR